VKKLIVDRRGEIIEHELNSTFVYLQSLAERLFKPKARIGLTAKDNLLCGFRFEGRGKLEELSV
jgi:hypothetical protein